jgi:hypothetical protein
MHLTGRRAGCLLFARLREPALIGRTPSGSPGASACHRHRARRPSRIRRREHRRRVAQLPAAGRRLSAAGSRPASRHSGARPRVGRPAYARTRRVATGATAASVTGASVVSVVVLIVSALRDLPLVAPNAERARALWGGARATRNVHVSAPDGRGGSIAGVRRADSLGLVRSTGWPRSSRIAIARWAAGGAYIGSGGPRVKLARPRLPVYRVSSRVVGELCGCSSPRRTPRAVAGAEAWRRNPP